MMKRFVLFFVLSLCVVSSAWAEIVASGSPTSGNACGDKCSWQIDSDGVLTIYGTGAMYDYEERLNTYWGLLHSDTPWQNQNFTSIVIQSGITHISAGAFNDLNIENCTIADSVTSIGMGAFTRAHIANIELPSSITDLEHAAFHRAVTDTLILESIETVEQGALSHMGNSIKSIVFGNPNVTFENNDAISNTNATIYCIKPKTGTSPCQERGNVKLYTIDENGVYSTTEEGVTKYFASPEDMANVSGSILSPIACITYEDCVQRASEYQTAKAESMAGGALCKTASGCLKLINMANKKEVCSNIAACKAYGNEHGILFGNKKVQNADGSYTLYDDDDNFIGFKGKRIYTVEEASKVVKPQGNTFKIRYK